MEEFAELAEPGPLAHAFRKTAARCPALTARLLVYHAAHAAGDLTHIIRQDVSGGTLERIYAPCHAPSGVNIEQELARLAVANATLGNCLIQPLDVGSQCYEFRVLSLQFKQVSRDVLVGHAGRFRPTAR